MEIETIGQSYFVVDFFYYFPKCFFVYELMCFASIIMKEERNLANK